MKILIRDESLTGKIAHSFHLQLDNSTITIRELIRSRVIEEVKIFNSNRSLPYMGLIQLRAEELLLNPDRSTRLKQLHADEEAALALKAFDNNSFLLLINNKQYSDPDETITLQADTTVSFVKLMPLVGG